MGKKILVFRFSALGDVAMTIPVLWSLARQYPDHKICLVSRPFAADLVKPLPNVHLFPLDLKGRHKDFPGLLRLYRDLQSEGPWEAVVDLHSVLRTHVLTTLFKTAGPKVSKIDKGRKAKKRLTRKKNKIFQPLLHTTGRYQEAFQKAGYSFELMKFPGKELFGEENTSGGSKDQTPPWGDLKGFTIGIAPFAKHHWKMWPEEKMLDLLRLLEKESVTVVFFGAPGDEQARLEEWSGTFENARTFAGQLNMAQELELMSSLDVMVSMDSANMHLASLAGTRVVSIWGATHPYAGFYGYGQDPKDAVQVDLSCRPCSVFGDKTCHRGDFACMMRITPGMIRDRIFGR